MFKLIKKIIIYFDYGKKKRLLEKSGYFDKAWYLNEYPDVDRDNINPYFHYMNYGFREGRNPSSKFDTNWYLASNSDVVFADINPLVHYIKYGRNEERTPLPSQAVLRILEFKEKNNQLNLENSQLTRNYEAKLKKVEKLAIDYSQELQRAGSEVYELKQELKKASKE
ncbi:MAG: hypothetical protein ACKVHQ_15065 [Gammaproteobacteria bacterium]|jgi:hypothetical protein